MARLGGDFQRIWDGGCVKLYLRILNAVDRITGHLHIETIYSKKQIDLGGFDQSLLRPIASAVSTKVEQTKIFHYLLVTSSLLIH